MAALREQIHDFQALVSTRDTEKASNTSPSRPPVHPLVKQVLKYGFYAAWGLFALLGLLVLPGVIETVRQIPLEPSCYIGQEACRQSKACAELPLPEQIEDAALFPMSVEYPELIGWHACVVFPAPALWQEAFHKLHPGGKGDAMPDDMPLDFAREEGIDPRMAEFISSRQWQPFHQGQLHPGKRNFVSLRDESGEYMLFYLVD